MARRDQRMKASDVFRESEHVFSRKASFDEAFPEIEDVVIEVTEKGAGVWHWEPGDSKRTYRKPNLPGEYVDCSNPLCYAGGVSVGSILREMVGEHAMERETSKVCRGYEGSPKGRRRYRKCVNFFKVKIGVTYKKKASNPTLS